VYISDLGRKQLVLQNTVYSLRERKDTRVIAPDFLDQKSVPLQNNVGAFRNLGTVRRFSDVCYDTHFG